MKQEAKVVYLLECLQKTSPPVSFVTFLTGGRHVYKMDTVFFSFSWLNIRKKCCKACGTGIQERYCLI